MWTDLLGHYLIGVMVVLTTTSIIGAFGVWATLVRVRSWQKSHEERDEERKLALAAELGNLRIGVQHDILGVADKFSHVSNTVERHDQIISQRGERIAHLEAQVNQSLMLYAEISRKLDRILENRLVET